MCKYVSSKKRADVGMVQFIPARYGKTPLQKNRRNKEEDLSMQRGGGGGGSRSCATRRRAYLCKTQVINMR